MCYCAYYSYIIGTSLINLFLLLCVYLIKDYIKQNVKCLAFFKIMSNCYITRYTLMNTVVFFINLLIPKNTKMEKYLIKTVILYYLYSNIF